jgi:integrase
LRNNLPAALLTKPAREVTSGDVRAALAVIHQRGARVLANRVRAYLHGVFSYGLQADHDPRRLSDPALFGIVVNPVTAIPRDSGAEVVGERALSWAEMALVWNAEEPAISWIARQGVRGLLLTGCRVNELIQAPWREFDLDASLWTLPATRVKAKRDHLLPIAPTFGALLRELREAYPGDWLFPARNVAQAGKPWGTSAMAHVCLHAARSLGIPEFNGRDLRRTWKTRGGEIGLSLEIRNRIQGHALTDVGSRHYDKYQYQKEKLAALETWERELMARIPH